MASLHPYGPNSITDNAMQERRISRMRTSWPSQSNAKVLTLPKTFAYLVLLALGIVTLHFQLTSTHSTLIWNVPSGVKFSTLAMFRSISTNRPLVTFIAWEAQMLAFAHSYYISCHGIGKELCMLCLQLYALSWAWCMAYYRHLVNIGPMIEWSRLALQP